jgi:hypothetical protein
VNSILPARGSVDGSLQPSVDYMPRIGLWIKRNCSHLRNYQD